MINMASMSSMRIWMVDMTAQEEIEQMKKVLADISKTAEDAMGDGVMGAKALMSFRWIKKLAKRGLGESDD
jgi:hypothetical protein